MLGVLPDPVTVAEDLVSTAGESLVNVATGVIPAVVGIAVIFWGIRFVLGKLGLRGKATSV